jgi:hypothetical protein
VERHRDVALILSEMDLHDVEKIVWGRTTRMDPGRPMMNLIDIFKALVVKRLR